MFDFFNNLGDAKTPILVFVGFMLLYIPGMLLYMKHKKNNVNKWLAAHPNAVKVFVDYDASIMKMGSLNILSVDDEAPILFNQGTKVGFYVTPGKHIINSSFVVSRPGIMYRSVTTTYGPSKQEIKTEAHKTYNYKFNRKDKSYDFSEITEK